MVRLDLTLSASSLKCLRLDAKTATVLGIEKGADAASFLADEEELQDLKEQVQNLMKEKETNSDAFSTFHLVFGAPNAQEVEPGTNRNPINAGK